MYTSNNTANIAVLSKRRRSRKASLPIQWAISGTLKSSIRVDNPHGPFKSWLSRFYVALDTNAPSSWIYGRGAYTGNKAKDSQNQDQGLDVYTLEYVKIALIRFEYDIHMIVKTIFVQSKVLSMKQINILIVVFHIQMDTSKVYMS